MRLKTFVKESFMVIGRLGSTKDGDGFVQKLWQNAEENFTEVEHLVKRNSEGNVKGFWGQCQILRGLSTHGKMIFRRAVPCEG